MSRPAFHPLPSRSCLPPLPGSERVVIGRLLAAGLLLLFLAVLAWAVGLTSYVVFRDEVLAGLTRRHQEVSTAYEDRIRDLKAELEKARSKALVEQAMIERKIEALGQRQAALEARQNLLSTLADRAPPARAEAVPVPRPAPISDSVILKPTLDREARLESRPVPPASASKLPGGGPRLATVAAAIDALELAQATALTTIEERAENRARRIRSVFADLGLAAQRFGPGDAALGGPFIPVTVAGTFEAQVARIAATVADMRRLEEAVTLAPFRRPVGAAAEITSGFGTRIDPFLKRLALHAGIDFRAETGTPVRATGGGRVKEAGWQGGFGNMVEVDHGGGLSTVYAHLSAIDVAAGEPVAVGQIVGRIGSTGRSTGPHLHYETHIDGEAVDPQRFLRAGTRLGLFDPG